MSLLSAESRDARITTLVKSRQDEAQERKDIFDLVADECMDWYTNMVKTGLPINAEWMRGDIIADAHRIVENTLPAWLSQLYERQNRFSPQAPTLAGEDYQFMVRELLLMQQRQMKWLERLEPMMRRGIIQGHLVHKTLYHREVADRLVPVFGEDPKVGFDGAPVPVGMSVEQDVIFSGPYTEFVDPKRYWKSALRTRLGHLLWTIESLTMDPDYMEEVNKKHGGSLYKNLDMVRKTVSVRPTAYTSGMGGMRFGGFYNDFIRSSSSAGSQIEDSTLEGRGALRLVQHFGLVPTEGNSENPTHEAGVDYEDSQWRMQLILPVGEGVVLRDTISPTPFLAPPHRDVPFIQVGDEPYGRSPLYFVGPEIEMRSEFRNLRLAESYLGILNPRIMNRAANWDQNTMGLYPDATWIFNNDALKAGDVAGVLPRSPMLPNAFQEDALMERHTLDTAGVPDFMRGEAFGARTTAKEVNLIENFASGRAKLRSIMMGLLIEQQHLEDCFRLSQMFMHDAQWVEFANQRGFTEQRQVSAADLLWDVDIYMEPDATLDAAQVESAIMVLQAGAQVPGLAEQIDFSKILLEMMDRMSFTNAQRFRRTPEEIQAQQQEGMQREMAMAAIQSQLQQEQAASRAMPDRGDTPNGGGNGSAGGKKQRSGGA